MILSFGLKIWLWWTWILCRQWWCQHSYVISPVPVDIMWSCLPDGMSLDHPCGIHQTFDTVWWACDLTTVTRQDHHPLRLYDEAERWLQKIVKTIQDITIPIRSCFMFVQESSSRHEMVKWRDNVPELKAVETKLIVILFNKMNWILHCDWATRAGKKALSIVTRRVKTNRTRAKTFDGL